MRRFIRSSIGLALLLGIAGCSGQKEADKDESAKAAIPQDGRSSYKVGTGYTIGGQFYRPSERFQHVETGRASWYGPGFHGKPTANGEIFDSRALTAAHRTLQLPSIIRVINLANSKSATLRVNDRGPYHGDRVLDVSEAAAEALGFKSSGVALVRIEVLEGPSREVAHLAKSGASVAEVDRVRKQAANGRAPVVATSSTRPSSTRANPSPKPKRQVAVAPPPSPPPPPLAKPAPQRRAPAATTAPPATASAQAPPRPPTRTADAPEAAKPDQAFVQVGVFGDVANVRRLETRLASVGQVNVEPFQASGRTLHRVRVGPFQTVASARSALERVVSLGVADARLVAIQ